MQSGVTGQMYYEYIALFLENILQHILHTYTMFHPILFLYMHVSVYIFLYHLFL